MAAIDEQTDEHNAAHPEQSDSQKNRDLTDRDRVYTQLQVNEDATHESDTTLLKAAASGNDADVRVLLKAGASVDQVDEKGKTPLMHAARNGHVGVIEALLDACANYDAVNLDGDSAVIIATRAGHWEVVVKLFTAGADTRIKNLRGQMAYGVAAPSIQSQFSDLLLGECENADLSRFDVDTLMVIAASRGKLRLVKHLLSLGVSPDAEVLLWYTDDPHRPNYGIGGEDSEGDHYIRTWECSVALIEAAKHGHLTAVEALLKAGANNDNENSAGQTALAYAAANGHPVVVSALIRAGAEIGHLDNFDRSPLMYACRRGHAAIVKLLLAEGADPHRVDIRSANVLVPASQNRHVEVVDLLLDAGVNPNHIYNARLGECFGHVMTYHYARMTALTAAVSCGSAPIVRTLLAAGSLIRMSSDEPEDALFIEPLDALSEACKCGDTVIVKRLLSALLGDDRCELINTAVGVAAARGHTEVVTVLLQAGADVNFPPSPGSRNALQSAAIIGKPAVVSILLAAGAMSAQAIEHALESQNIEVIEMLLEASAGTVECTGRPLCWRKSSIDLLMAHGADPYWVLEVLGLGVSDASPLVP